MPGNSRRRVVEQGTLRLNPILIKMRPEQMGLARTKGQQPPPAEDTSSTGGPELQGVYIISVAARLLEMHPQTLRKYERLGLVSPSRTIGMLRLYSEEDIEKLRLIKYLEENLGLNLAGVEFTLNMLGQLLDMLQRLSRRQEAEDFIGMVEQEMSRLFQRLNLPIQ